MKKMILVFSMLVFLASQAWSDSFVSIKKDELMADFSLQIQGRNLVTTQPIVAVEVLKVYSSSYPDGEAIDEGQLSTIYHHEGKEIYVVTFEMGEGIEPAARIKNISLPAKYEIEMLAVCNKNGQIVECRNGGEFFGKIRLWNISAYGNGLFSYQIKSIAPGNKIFNTKLEIK